MSSIKKDGLQMTLEEKNKNNRERAAQLKRWKDLQLQESQPTRPAVRRFGRHVDFEGRVKLLAACAEGETDDVRQLIKAGVDPNSKNVDGLTPLHQAALDDNEELAVLLIGLGADVNARDRERWTPLHAAANGGYLDIVKLLLKKGADLISTNCDGNTPLDVAKASEEDCSSVITFLTQQHQLANVTESKLAEVRKSYEMLILADAKQRVRNNTPDLLGEAECTLLHVAAANGFMDVITTLVEGGANVNAKDEDGWTPLHAAVHWAKPEAVTYLALHGANLNAKTNNGELYFEVVASDDSEMSSLLTSLPALVAESKTKSLQNLQSPIQDVSRAASVASLDSEEFFRDVDQMSESSTSKLGSSDQSSFKRSKRAGGLSRINSQDRRSILHIDGLSERMAMGIETNPADLAGKVPLIALQHVHAQTKSLPTTATSPLSQSAELPPIHSDEATSPTITPPVMMRRKREQRHATGVVRLSLRLLDPSYDESANLLDSANLRRIITSDPSIYNGLSPDGLEPVKRSLSDSQMPAPISGAKSPGQPTIQESEDEHRSSPRSASANPLERKSSGEHTSTRVNQSNSSGPFPSATLIVPQPENFAEPVSPKSNRNDGLQRSSSSSTLAPKTPLVNTRQSSVKSKPVETRPTSTTATAATNAASLPLKRFEYAKRVQLAAKHASTLEKAEEARTRSVSPARRRSVSSNVDTPPSPSPSNTPSSINNNSSSSALANSASGMVRSGSATRRTPTTTTTSSQSAVRHATHPPIESKGNPMSPTSTTSKSDVSGVDANVAKTRLGGLEVSIDPAALSVEHLLAENAKLRSQLQLTTIELDELKASWKQFEQEQETRMQQWMKSSLQRMTEIRAKIGTDAHGTNNATGKSSTQSSTVGASRANITATTGPSVTTTYGSAYPRTDSI